MKMKQDSRERRRVRRSGNSDGGGCEGKRSEEDGKRGEKGIVWAGLFGLALGWRRRAASGRQA